MGSATRKVNDHFTGVLGERRGIRQGQEALSSAPPSLAETKKIWIFPFSSDPRAAYRLPSLVEYLAEQGKITAAPEDIVQESAIYNDCLVISENQRECVNTAEITCHQDLEVLISEGLCYKNNGYGGIGRLKYGLCPFKEWPEKYQQAFDSRLAIKEWEISKL